MNTLKWLYPGLKVKRWLLLSFLGLFLLGTGLAIFNNSMLLGFFEAEIRDTLYLLFGGTNSWLTGSALAAGGLLLFAFGVQRLMGSIIRVIQPGGGAPLVEVIYRRRYLERGPKIVALGGGTGLAVLLRGLKEYTSNITAIVTVSDDGGSSGRLRGDLGILPPGDIRNCLAALADTEGSMDRVLNYRFPGSSELAGHSLGNLLLAALAGTTGGFEQAVQEVGKILAIRGVVLPATLDNVVLAAEMADGRRLEGETQITAARSAINRVWLEPGNCHPLSRALQAIAEADLIVLGPGSLYTSVLPTLLVPGISGAIHRTRATVVYVCNIMTQPGETAGYSAAAHLQAINLHCGSNNLVDVVVVHRGGISTGQERRYRERGAEPVGGTRVELERLGARVVVANLLARSSEVRHDSSRLARLLLTEIWKTGGRWAQARHQPVAAKRLAHPPATFVD